MNHTNYISYRFTFDGPLHIGDARPDDYGKSEEYLHSDTLHAALLATRAKMGLAVPGAEGPGYALSSCFPFATVGGKDVYFFPKPQLPFELGEVRIDFAKKLKRIRWVDADYLGKILNGEPLDLGGKKQPHLQGDYLSTTPLGEKNITSSSSAQRVTVPRFDGTDATPFVTERLFFADGAGLFCLFIGNEAQRKAFEQALELLQHEGIGTDRAVGNGRFSYTRSEVALRLPATGNYGVNLSLFCPESKMQLDEMLDSEQAAYTLLRRGGWVTTEGSLGNRKRSISMFREGGVFRTGETLAGRPGIDLAPLNAAGERILEHPVWRNGQSIFLPVKLS